VPSSELPFIGFKKRFRKTAKLQKPAGIPEGGIEFGQAQRMETIEMISSQQGIAPLAVIVERSRSDYDEGMDRMECVKQPLEHIPPAGIFVQFVENDQPFRRGPGALLYLLPMNMSSQLRQAGCPVE